MSQIFTLTAKNQPFELDSHDGDVSVHDGPLGLAAALQGVSPGLQLFLSLLVKRLQPVRLATTTGTQDYINSTSDQLSSRSHNQAPYLISALVWAACTCFPRGDSTLSLSIWHKQYFVLKAWLSYRIACRTRADAPLTAAAQRNTCWFLYTGTSRSQKLQLETTGAEVLLLQ